MNNFDLGDLLSLIIVFAVYLTAASGKKKKGKKKRRTSMRSRARGEQHDPRAKEQDKQTLQGFDDAFAVEAPVNLKEHPRQMHLHEVTQQQFAHAAEGEDPCHAGDSSGLYAENVRQESAFEMIQTEDGSALAQDVLRGVIMSEILTRPQDRAVLRRGRR